MSSKMEYYCERTPPNSVKIHNVKIGRCTNLTIDPHRVIGDTCQYCKYMKMYFCINTKTKAKIPKRKKKDYNNLLVEDMPVEIDIPDKEPVEELTDLDILDLIGETGLEIS